MITIRDLNTQPHNPYYEFDLEAQENIFSNSMEHKPAFNEDRNTFHTNEGQPTALPQEILYSLNYFPKKPVLLTTNLVSKEDPSWGISNESAKYLVSQTEEKGHYQHLSTFLEDTICQRREPACTAVIPSPQEESGTPRPPNDLYLDQIPTFREEGVNTVECSLASSLNYKQMHQLRMNKVVLGRGLKEPESAIAKKNSSFYKNLKVQRERNYSRGTMMNFNSSKGAWRVNFCSHGVEG